MERIVRSSHKPCLVTPRAYQPLKRIFLAYDGGKSCQKAIAYLAKLPAIKDLELHIITVNTENTANADRRLKEAQSIIEQANLIAFLLLSF